MSGAGQISGLNARIFRFSNNVCPKTLTEEGLKKKLQPYTNMVSSRFITDIQYPNTGSGQ